MSVLNRTFLCMAFFFCLSASQLQGQVVYTISGQANNFPLLGLTGLSPEVAAFETYEAQFLIDTSVADSNLADPTSGIFEGAILSSAIEFSGGYISLVDFAGGDVNVLADSDGRGITLTPDAPAGVDSGSEILVFEVNDTLDSDALITDLGTAFDGGPQSLYSLAEPSGRIVSFGNVGFGQAPIAFAVSVSASAVPEPSSALLLGIGTLSMVAPRRRK